MSIIYAYVNGGEGEKVLIFCTEGREWKAISGDGRNYLQMEVNTMQRADADVIPLSARDSRSPQVQSIPRAFPSHCKY